VSTDDQHTALQRAGCTPLCTDEGLSGTITKRPASPVACKPYVLVTSF